MRKKTMTCSMVILCIVAFVTFAGCFDKKEPGGYVYLTAEYETEYADWIGYNVYGTVTNQGNATAHNTYVNIKFNNTSDSILHDYRISLGDLSPSEKRSFQYFWTDNRKAKAYVKVRAYSDEFP